MNKWTRMTARSLIRQRIFQIRGIALAIILGGFSSSGIASTIQDIPAYTLRYAVTFQGNSLGELEISIRHQNEKIVVRGETFPNALAQMFGDGKVIETVEYIQQGNTLRLKRLTEQKGLNSPTTKTLTIDHISHQVSADGQQIGLDSNDQIDAYTFPLLSILGLSDVNPGDQVKLVSVEKIRRYRYLEPLRETIHNRAGSFATLKQSRSRVNSSKTIALWITEKKPIMPVQIQVERNDGHQMLVSLISISR